MSYFDFVVYELATGWIDRCVNVTAGDILANVEEGFSAVPNSGVGNDSQSYVDVSVTPHAHVAKQALTLPDDFQIIADGTDEAVVTDIPQGVFVTWPDGVREEVTDGVVEFSVTQPGNYTLTFGGIKYLEKEVHVEALPQS